MSIPLRLLQVEDSLSDSALIVRLLEKAGFDVQAERVETAAQMQTALAKQPWDAIVADYHLPQFNAPAALNVLHESGLDIPFLVVSGAVGEDLAVAIMKAGAQDYLMKNNLARLGPAISREIHDAQVRHERKRADRLLDAVFTAQMDALIVYSPAGVAIRTNPAAAAIYGFEPAGMAIGDILRKLGLSFLLGHSATERALVGETVPAIEQQAGQCTFEASAAPLYDAAGHIVGAVTNVRDISEKRRAAERLQQAEKLKSIGLLAGGIAHDFNNIITAVSGNIALAIEDACPHCEGPSVLPAALESLHRAASLTRQLLAYAGKGAFTRKVVPVSAMAVQALAILTPSLPPRVHIVTDLARGLPTVFMDPAQMELVLSSLILNGVEAIPEGQSGTVTVRTEWQCDSICIEVSDNGCGMDTETQKRIFDPFFTTKFPGRGLGLAAVEGIVRSLNGRIAVESTVGCGTCIRLLLPPAESAEPGSSAAPAMASPDEYGAVLVVDDEPLVRKMARAMLKKRGIVVLEASNGQEAIERLTEQGDNVRAVLLDVDMPGMGLDETLPMIRKMRPDIHMIVSSGFLDSDLKQHFRHIDACQFLPKPYTPEQLFAEILPAVSRL